MYFIVHICKVLPGSTLVWIFFQNFGKRLACNTRCESMAPGSSEREACEKENCIEIVSEDAEGREEDEYDYSYGYDDESLNEVSDNEE